MTPEEYKQYEKAVKLFFKNEGLNCLTTDMAHYPEGCIEPHFSWMDCDCCGRPLGGDRTHANGFNPASKQVQGGYLVCTDCMYYVEYGQLDDMTMLEVNKT